MQTEKLDQSAHCRKQGCRIQIVTEEEQNSESFPSGVKDSIASICSFAYSQNEPRIAQAALKFIVSSLFYLYSVEFYVARNFSNFSHGTVALLNKSSNNSKRFALVVKPFISLSEEGIKGSVETLHIEEAPLAPSLKENVESLAPSKYSKNASRSIPADFSPSS